MKKEKEEVITLEDLKAEVIVCTVERMREVVENEKLFYVKGLMKQIKDTDLFCPEEILEKAKRRIKEKR